MSKESEDISVGEGIFGFLVLGVIAVIAFFIFGRITAFFLNLSDPSPVYEYVMEDGEITPELTLKVDEGFIVGTLALIMEMYTDTTTDDEFVTKNGKVISLNGVDETHKMVINSTGKPLHISLESYGVTLKSEIPRKLVIQPDEGIIVMGFTSDNIGCENQLPDRSSESYEYWVGHVPHNQC